MTSRSITRLRRVAVHPAPVEDSVILAGVLLKCTLCGETWTAPLVSFSDEIDQGAERCPSCTPAAA
jgi:hypothetical protein